MREIDRREFLKWCGGTLGVILIGCQGREEELEHAVETVSPPGSEPVSLVIDGIRITPNEEFYVLEYSSPGPVEVSSWQLRVDGLVERPLTLTYDEILALPSLSEMRTLECISNPAGGSLIGNAVWEGVRLADILNLAGVKPGAVEVRFECTDGYHTSIPLDWALHPHSLLVYKMNNETLPQAHGFPLRALFPGVYGMKQPKRIQRIEVIDNDYQGYWETRGWSDAAPIKPNARIDHPRFGQNLSVGKVVVDGLAFAGASGIAKVELSFDEGSTWREAELVRGPTPYVWVQWSYGWEAGAGRQPIWARVTDDQGRTQERPASGLLQNTFPDGTSDMHVVWVQVS